MQFIKSSAARGNPWFNKLCICLLLGLMVASSAGAANPLYQNLSDSTYSLPAAIGSSVPPQIDATNFDNEALFSISFNSLKSGKAQLFQTQDTLNYTNGDNGTMVLNNPVISIGLFSAFFVTFEFDYYTPSGTKMANTFFNQGTIRCNSNIDGNNLFSSSLLTTSEYTTSGQCIISATNVYNPGNIIVGVEGLLDINGQNVDLSRGVFNMEGLLNENQNGLNFTFFNAVNLSSTGGVGLDTNGDWNPAFDLTSTQALSSSPDFLFLSNSAAYFDVKGQGTSNVVYRAVFVQDKSRNVTYRVFIDDPNAFPTLGFEAGAAHVEWTGAFNDPATGTANTSYLYLTDDYAFGATTNVAVIRGVPDNFSFVTSPTPLLGNNPTPQQFLNVFPNGAISNRYAFFNGQIIATTTPTNATSANPGGTLTNLPNRFNITASKSLNLQNAIISGQDFLTISATNQFEGSAGAQIAAPFSNLNLAVTNGNIVISNLLESAILNWSGSVQAWSTRWTNTDTTTGITSDYRVMLVASDLNPITAPYVTALKVHATNSLVISDVLNVFGSISIDSQNLTVSTNGPGNGASSLEGELNSLTPGNLGPAQMPNLRWLTNNGAIRSQGLLIFTNINNFGAVINHNLIADQGTVIYATNFFSDGTISNSGGNFTVRAHDATLTNAFVYAGGAASIVANNIIVSNLTMRSLSLTLNPTNFLTDCGVSNGSIWVVGRTNATGGSGFSLLYNPTNGDLLGTTITNICPPANKLDANIWAGRNFGPINRGYTNNAALGRLVLDVVGPSSLITFNGTGTNNALYVDSIEFRDVLTSGTNTSYDFTNWLSLNTNIVIYFAQAYINGVSVAEKIDSASVKSGRNGGSISNGVVTPGRLRWVPTYAGNFSSTNLVIGGVTNTVNAALAQSTTIDSDGDGVANAFDSTPFFTPDQLNLTIGTTNFPSLRAVLAWNTVPFGTNYVYFRTSLLTNTWQLYTSFLSTNVAGLSYSTSVTDTNIVKGIRFYQVLVQPWLTYPY